MLCGIEIHQRIAGRKLFCGCTQDPAQNAIEVALNRRLHSVRSELGELDDAVRLESLRSRQFQYRAQG